MPIKTKAAFLAVFVTMTVLLLAGCAGPKAPPPSQMRIEAIRHNDRGVREEARGAYEAALAEFAAALRLHAAIENEAGMVVALVNIARTSRARGEMETARQAVERAAALIEKVPDLAAEVLFERGKIALAAGDLEGAGRLAGEALAAEKGEGLAARYNLAALVLYRQEDRAGAKRLAETALQHCRSPEQQGEAANAHRLLGDIHLDAGDPAAANDHFAAALGRDKALGRSERIARDLRGLAEAALRRGARAEAVGYLQRARDVSASAGDTTAAGADETRLAELELEVVSAEATNQKGRLDADESR